MGNDTMILSDILIDLSLGDHQLKSFLANFFSVNPQEVLLIDDVEEFPRVEEPSVVCQVTRFDEGFRTLLSLHLFGIDNPGTSLLVRSVCEHFESRCLIPSEGNNPYEMIEVEATGTMRTVFLDEFKLDEDGLYFLAKP